MNERDKIERLLFLFDDLNECRQFTDEDYFILLDKVFIIKDNQEILSMDLNHRYSNTSDVFYGIDQEGYVYSFSKKKQRAERIDCFNKILKK